MSNISKIKISGTSYSIKDENACNVVELTQAEYDALETKDTNTFYIITDAQGADLSQYYTSAQTESAITQAVSGKVDTATFNTYSGSVETALSAKQDTLVSGTNIKTINNESILGEGNITIEGGSGGSITVDQSLDSGSTNAVANSAITNAINDRQLKREYVGSEKVFSSFDAVNRREIQHPVFRCFSNNSTNTELVLENKDLGLYFPTVNGKYIFSTNKYETNWLGDVIEASAITTSVTSESTDAQVPSAKAVYDMVGNINTILESI